MAPSLLTTMSLGELSSCPAVVRCDHLAARLGAVGVQLGPNDMACPVLADDQAEVSVERQAVAHVGRLHDLDDSIAFAPSAPHVARHVAEEQVATRVPDRPFGELEAGCELLNLDIGIDQLADELVFDAQGHVSASLGM